MSDLISRKDAIALVNRPIVPTGDAVYDNAREDERASIKDDLLSLPSAEQKTKCIAQIKIDREDMEDLVNEKVNEIVDKMAEPKTMDKTNANKIYNYLKEQIGDTVDDMKDFDAWFERMVWHVKECNRLTAEPKKGKWIQDDDYICDQCGYHMIVGGGAYNFCPNCGADMRGEEE